MNTNNLLLIAEEYAKATELEFKAARKEEEARKAYDSFIAGLTEAGASLAEKITRRKTEADHITILSDNLKEAKKQHEKAGAYTKAVKAQYSKELQQVICTELLKNKKIDGQPVRYKAVQNAVSGIEALKGLYNIRISHDGYITAYTKDRNGFNDMKLIEYLNPARHEYDKNYKSEYYMDFSILERRAGEYKHIAAGDIADQFEKYIAAREAINEARKEYEKKIEAIKAGAECVGIDWNYKLYYLD